MDWGKGEGIGVKKRCASKSLFVGGEGGGGRGRETEEKEEIPVVNPRDYLNI